MNTPADKPDLPAPSKIVELIQKTIAKSGHQLTEAQAILLIGALAVWIPAIRADERRKALRDVKLAVAEEYTKRRHERGASEYSEGFLDGLDRADLCIRSLIDKE